MGITGILSALTLVALAQVNEQNTIIYGQGRPAELEEKRWNGIQGSQQEKKTCFKISYCNFRYHFLA